MQRMASRLRILALAVLIVTFGSAPETSMAEVETRPELQMLVVGDSYSAGNGAGEYYGPAGCWRSEHNYAGQYRTLLASAPYDQPSTVTNAACSGAETQDFFDSKDGRPPMLSAVNASYDVIFLTIGGNDVFFADIVKYCLVARTRDGATCDPNLARAERMLSDGTVEGRIENVLRSRSKMPRLPTRRSSYSVTPI